MDFKGSLVDEHNLLSSWKGRDCCSWDGIVCHFRTGFVQGIDLQGYFVDKNTQGSHINSSLLQLEHLEHLDLSINIFSGIPIPAFLGSLRNLRYLDLSESGFSGEIPHSLGNLSNLQHLSLGEDEPGGRSFTSLSSKRLGWIGGLSSLRSLEIIGVNLSESIDWLDSINMLSSLSSLALWNCGLVGMALSRDLNLTSLASINLYQNNLNSALPPSFFNLTSLQDIQIMYSGLKARIPNMFHKLTSLNSLDLSNNSFNSSIPDSLCALNVLTNLDFAGSELHGSIPFCLGNLTNLRELILGSFTMQDRVISHNSLIGELSESFFKRLKSLEALDISGNQFIALNVSSQIKYLNMGSVIIGTPFPAWLQTQTKLDKLNLRNTSIFGPIPTFTKAKTITSLDLSSNQLSGNIPDELCNLRSMSFLNLANNRLTGKIPSCLGNLGGLAVLDLANNSLSGQIPLSLQYLTNLIALDLGKNEFQGSIPNWIGKHFLYLEHLMLQSNKFSGEISVNLCQLPCLHTLNLADNKLIGAIPPCLGNLNETVLYHYSLEPLYDTPLAITIKGIELEYSSNLKYAKFISLSGNHLHGEIPDQLMDLTEFQSLNLSNNDLSGKIPERIGNMKHLESLDLSRNRLSGTIPQSLVGIDDLEYLKLSFNKLSGGHFDTFDNPSIYQGNVELCGKPTAKRCDDDGLVPSKQNGHDSDDDGFFEREWIYAGIGPGFAVGFLGVFCILFLKSSWRYALFRFLENVYYRF